MGKEVQDPLTSSCELCPEHSPCASVVFLLNAVLKVTDKVPAFSELTIWKDEDKTTNVNTREREEQVLE